MTTRKVKVIGQQEYLNTSTGELEIMNVTTVEEKDFNFTKVWLTECLSKLGIISNQKTKFAYWFIDHLNRENMVTMTYRQLSEASGISYQTVSNTMQALIEANFIVKINSGCYMVNPNVMFKGTKNARQNLLIQYNDTVAQRHKEKDSNQTPLEEKLVQLENNKKLLSDNINKLEREINEIKEELEERKKRA